MRAPGIVRVLRDVSDFLGSSVSARDGPVAVTPEDYLAASGEVIALAMAMSWIMAAIWNRDAIRDNPLLDRLGYNNVCVAWDEPPALYPACVLLKGVLDHERARLQIVRRHAEGHWSLAKPKRVQGLLADKDVASIIVRRIERLDYLRNTLNKYAKAERAVPTAYVAPILAKLQTELSLLEDILETDLAPNESLGGQTVAGYTLWFFASTASSEHKAMRNELEAVRMLGRRLAAIKYTAIEFAARGQLGVKQGTPEEAALDTSKL